jgi:protein-disulfide isomerase
MRVFSAFVLILAGLVGCGTLPTGGCKPPAEITDDAIHDYLVVRHPEVLREMSQALRDRQQATQAAQAREALAANGNAVYRDAADPVVGNPDGDVTVVEFFDFECPFCKRLAPELKRLYAGDAGVRVVYKQFPILGPVSVAAAKAALASAKQGRYEAFHDALMADQTPEHQLTEQHLLEVASSVQLDIAKLQADMASSEIEAKIAATTALARQIGLSGTPGVIIGETLVPGAMSFEALKTAVAAARENSANSTH